MAISMTVASLITSIGVASDATVIVVTVSFPRSDVVVPSFKFCCCESLGAGTDPLGDGGFVEAFALVDAPLFIGGFDEAVAVIGNLDVRLRRSKSDIANVPTVGASYRRCFAKYPNNSTVTYVDLYDRGM